MAKTPTTTEGAVAPEGAGLDVTAAPASNPDADDPVTLPGETSAYEQAEAFQPDPWDQMPEDPEVRRLYLAIHGDVNFFVR